MTNPIKSATKTLSSRILQASIFCLSASLCIGIQYLRPHGKSPSQNIADFDFLQSTNLASFGSQIGYSGLSSSLLWLDFIQYFGSANRSQTGYRYSSEYLQSIAEIEPRFSPTYKILTSALGLRSGQPDIAQEILISGMNVITPDWSDDAYRLPYQLASINFLFLGNSEAGRDSYFLAADWYEATHADSAQSWRELGDALSNNPRSKLVQFNVWNRVYENLRADPEAQAFVWSRLAELGSVGVDENGREYIIPPAADE